MTEVKHTPLIVGGHSGRMIFNNIGTQIANCGTQEEAHMFVKCVNMHDELVEALETMVGVIDYYASLKKENKPNIEDWAYSSSSHEMGIARAALKKAGAL